MNINAIYKKYIVELIGNNVFSKPIWAKIGGKAERGIFSDLKNAIHGQLCKNFTIQKGFFHLKLN